MPRKKKKQSIIKTKSHKKHHISRKEAWIFVLLVFLGCILTGILFWINLPKPSSIPMAASATIKENNQQQKYSIDIEYPQISGISNANIQQMINQAINFMLQDTVTQFKKDATQTSPLVPDTFSSSLTIRYTVERLDKKIVSILFTVANFPAGAAHPIEYALPFNYDIPDNKELKFSDVFIGANVVSFLSQYCSDNLKKQYARTHDNFDEFIVEGASPKETNFEKFVFSPLGVIIIFDPATVGPYAAGMRQVTIPYNLLQGMLHQEFSL